MKLTHLRTNHRKNPVGIDQAPYFSWWIESEQEDTFQTKYQIQVYVEEKCIWDSAITESDKQNFVRFNGKLSSKTHYRWIVRVWDNYGNQTQESAYFETAYLKIDEWRAKWILSTIDLDSVSLPPFWSCRPPVWFEKKFRIEGNIRWARLYATAHGIYYAYVNGSRPDLREFAPEHTVYDSIQYYQTYQVESLLHNGENKLKFQVADGWYHCPQTRQEIQEYDEAFAVLFQLEIEYEDGRHQFIGSDGSEICYTGKIVYSDLFQGEKENAMLEESIPCPVKLKDFSKAKLVAQPTDPVGVYTSIPAEKVYRSPKGEWIVDFGQIVTGRARVNLCTPPQTQITLEYFEIPDRAGNYLNTMFAPQKDIYISDGKPVCYEAHFTFHGFRYLRVTGMETVKAENFIAVALTSEKEDLGRFDCSDQRLTRLYENIRWSQRNNTLSVPTDCPTREKAGFTGDIQIYAGTAIRNENMTPFLTGWLRNLEAAQADNGAVPIVVPETAPYIGLMKKNTVEFGDSYPAGVAGWSDAAILVPYEMYLATGNREILKQQYSSMTRWCDYIIHTAKDGLWHTGFHFGEWLIPSLSNIRTHRESCESSAFYTAPIFGWISIQCMARICCVLEKTEARYYQQKADEMKKRIQESLIVDGTMKTENMGAYVLMIALELISDSMIETFGEKLVELLEIHHGCLDTGFLATPFLLQSFVKIGRKDLAIQILFQNQCPSWLYQVEHGATAIWESWDAILPDQEPKVTSYDHYAFGCVDQWIFEYVIGIRPLQAGFKHVRIAPEPESIPLTHCERSYRSEYGLLKVYWDTEELRVSVPCGMTAEIHWKEKKYTVGSGKYVF